MKTIDDADNRCLAQNAVYIEGRTACINKLSTDANPYNVESDIVKHSIWNRGWFDQDVGR
jgi:hypothetical protein